MDKISSEAMDAASVFSTWEDYVKSECSCLYRGREGPCSWCESCVSPEELDAAKAALIQQDALCLTDGDLMGAPVGRAAAVPSQVVPVRPASQDGRYLRNQWAAKPWEWVR